MGVRTFFADPAYLEMCLRLLGALAVGGLIGLERSYHGRAAGFRTHALVCLSTSLLMLVTVYETRWFAPLAQARITLDPTRMVQGIMTGIGFLGAGTIIQEGATVRGLTTAASIWMTAALGVLFGIGFFFPAVVSTFLTLGILSAFRWIENRIPAQFYAQFVVRFARTQTIPEEELRALLREHGFTIANLSYHSDFGAGFCAYEMVVRTSCSANAAKLTTALNAAPSVREFRLSPISG
jgi:putative Mg2+ transporter-C (MgtC) family protein